MNHLVLIIIFTKLITKFMAYFMCITANRLFVSYTVIDQKQKKKMQIKIKYDIKKYARLLPSSLSECLF